MAPSRHNAIGGDDGISHRTNLGDDGTKPQCDATSSDDDGTKPLCDATGRGDDGTKLQCDATVRCDDGTKPQCDADISFELDYCVYGIARAGVPNYEMYESDGEWQVVRSVS